MKNEHFKLQKLEINGYKLDSTEIKSISVYNNIDNLGLQLNIIYNDTTDIKNKMPLIGNEEIEIHIIDKFKNDFKKTFLLTKVQEINKESEKDVMIQIKGITKDSLIFASNKIYKNYNTSIANIIDDITESKMECDVKDIIQFISPGWSITKCMRYLSRISPNYYYFEEINGYKFDSLDNILANKKEDEYKLNSHNPHYQFLIEEMEEKSLMNTTQEMYNGLYSNTVSAYNPDSKSTISKSSNIKNIQENQLTLGSGTNYNTIGQELNSQLTYKPFYSTDILTNQSENSIKDLMWNKVLELLVPGDFEKEVGSIINIKYKDRFNNNLNPQLNGYYLVSKIAYHFTWTNFKCKMEVKKNSWFKGDVKTNVIV